jgi:hypothetical protein
MEIWHALLASSLYTWDMTRSASFFTLYVSTLKCVTSREIWSMGIFKTAVLFEEHMLNMRENKLHLYRWTYRYFNNTTVLCECHQSNTQDSWTSWQIPNYKYWVAVTRAVKTWGQLDTSLRAVNNTIGSKDQLQNGDMHRLGA